MQIIRPFYSVIAIALLLTSCYSGRMIIDSTPDGRMGVDEYTTAKLTDKVDFISLGATAPIADDHSCLGTRFQFGSFKDGIISGQLFYKAKLGRDVFHHYKTDQFVLPIIANGAYAYRFLSWEKVGKIKIPLSETAYTVDESTSYYGILCGEGGIGISKVNNKSMVWAEQKMASSDVIFEDGFPKGRAIINQSSVSGYVGLRFSYFLNTFISGKSDGVTYAGRRKELWDIRLGLKPLIYAAAPDIHYTYFSTTDLQTVDEFVPVNSFLTKNYIGFNFGVSWTTIIKNTVPISISYALDLGVEPGYTEKYMNTFYGRLGLFLGFEPTRKK